MRSKACGASYPQESRIETIKEYVKIFKIRIIQPEFIQKNSK
ncbi:hypothetical protein LEP1GSC060_2948 [Leptospira weilii serovar Ranarum str. ICFT]|uniref:Uncharacterized protein n=1 Tax=Leptospira weilii serovar Ranarum str. ICFT TaxID=1218598 RepID=N1WEY2_9LEPT|nr:hypothetical protein LEP1GSC060_2948 [Leptospira weilii serovar Ranarum str. ICFT]